MKEGCVQRAVTFEVGGATLVGIVTLPPPGVAIVRGGTGLLIVVGGPQYRVGSHRQFVLLARAAARQGIPAMRFDFAGMGDSSGQAAGFGDRDGEICAAVDAFVAAVPSVTNVALWGLCDGASAVLLYGPLDPRVTRMVVINPWTRSEEGLARTQLKHHYLKSVFSAVFWRRLVGGEVRVARSARELVTTLLRARGGATAAPRASFQSRMADGWRRFRGDILLICSGDDMTAREFEEHAARDPDWQGLLTGSRVVRRALADADHTFSRAVWRDRVATWTSDWILEREAVHTDPS